MAVAKIGDSVRIHYTGRLEDGTVFGSSRDKEPIEFVVGGDELIKGVSFGVAGMAEGEKKVLIVPPEEGYGQPRPELISEFPKEALPGALEPRVGMVLNARAPSGQEFTVTVVEVKEESVVLDANHPLAGKTLVFEIELLSINPKQ